jgi:diadenosine tetraphosphate (Ap4A) HIT family hydrolase
MPMPCDLCAAIDPAIVDCALQRHLRPDQPRRVDHSAAAAAVPTIGAFLPGYLLIVPTRHTTSLGQLSRGELAGVQQLTERAAARLRQVYGGPVLGFEYGLNVPGARRIEHGHLHLLPTPVGAALRGFLRFRLPLIEVDSLLHLPSMMDRSYVSVWEPGRPVSIYPIANNASPRLRLRKIVAEFDPRLRGRAWDWETDPCPALMRQTIDDLAPVPAGVAQ